MGETSRKRTKETEAIMVLYILNALDRKMYVVALGVGYIYMPGRMHRRRIAQKAFLFVKLPH